MATLPTIELTDDEYAAVLEAFKTIPAVTTDAEAEAALADWMANTLAEQTARLQRDAVQRDYNSQLRDAISNVVPAFESPQAKRRAERVAASAGDKNPTA